MAAARIQKILLARDYQSLSLFRILFAAFLLTDFFREVLPYFDVLFSDQGILPRAIVTADWRGPGLASLLLISDQPLFYGLFIAAHVLALLAFLFGYKTRWANLVVFITYTSMYWRNPMLSAGPELLAKLFLLWSLFLPLNRYWSVDSALDPAPRNRFYPALPIFAVKLQISMLYFFSGLYKLAGPVWLNGSGVRLALQDNWYTTTYGLYLADHFPDLLAVANYGVIAFQLLFTLLVYWPWGNRWTRGFALIGAFIMHLSFAILLKVGSFPVMCIIYLVLLIPDEWWNGWLARRRARLGKVRIYYESGCAFCQKTALLFREFCLPPNAAVLPADEDAKALGLLRTHNSWVVYAPDGEVHLKWRAVAYVLRQNPLLAPLGWITDRPFARPLMERIYRWIGDRRPLLGRASAVLLPFKTQSSLPMPLQIFCLFLALLAFGSNLFSIDRPKIDAPWFQEIADDVAMPMPSWVRDGSGLFQANQRWSLFAPRPSNGIKWMSIIGHRADGSTVDIETIWPGVPYRYADGVLMDFVSHRWKKYFDRLVDVWLMRSPAERMAFSQFLCHMVNGEKPLPAESLHDIQINFSVYRFNGLSFNSTKEEYSKTYFCIGQNSEP